MSDLYFERWIANDALQAHNAREATVLVDGVAVCGVVRDTGERTVFVSITKPYTPESTRILFGE